MEYEIVVDEYYFTVKVTSYTPAEQGVYHAAPENCYPAEPEQIEWELVDGMIYDENGENPRMLTPEELKQAEIDHAELISSLVENKIHDEQDGCDCGQED